MESRMASHAMANPQRLTGGLLAQGQSSKDASNSHHAHVVVLSSGVELEDPYKDLEVEVDGDPKRDRMEMSGEKDNPSITSSTRVSEAKKVEKDVDGYVEDLPYEEEAIEEVPLQHTKKVTKNSVPPKISSKSQLVSNIPYPSRAIKSRENFKYAKFCDMLEKLEVTLPFTEVIRNMPTYSKVLKDILTKKRVLGDQDIVAMEESFAKKIGIQNLAPTTMTLQLANRTIKRPLGVLEDVPIKVGKLLIRADFVVLDILEDSHTPIILGRPFLATGGVLIDVKNGRLTFQIEGNNVKFNLPHLMKGPRVERLSTTEVIDEVVHEVARQEAEMEEVFQISLHDEAMKEDHDVDEELLKKVEGFLPSKVQLKPLPPSLMYAFLGEGETYPVIINTNLSEL
ncbi:uncharacterized protein LOC141613791 [Silene latifolia]|uniref:uncharacterized protein LOC141613791 n=1 Tax=Silene latifolia TaxID=37657 RepID=UPI003D7856DC